MEVARYVTDLVPSFPWPQVDPGWSTAVLEHAAAQAAHAFEDVFDCNDISHAAAKPVAGTDSTPFMQQLLCNIATPGMSWCTSSPAVGHAAT